MFRGYDMRQKVVVDVNNAERLGTVADVEIDERSGELRYMIVRRHGGIFPRMFGWGELEIPWNAVTAVGREFILVNSLFFGEKMLEK